MERHGAGIEHFDESDQPFHGLEVTARFEGPIPPPRLLAGYEEVQPGLADRIVSMSERSLDAQIEMDSIDRRAEAFALRVATIAVTFFPWLTIIAAVVLVVLGYSAAAILTGAVGLLVAGPQIIAATQRSRG